jgi:hypothetical protein
MALESNTLTSPSTITGSFASVSISRASSNLHISIPIGAPRFYRAYRGVVFVLDWSQPQWVFAQARLWL